MSWRTLTVEEQQHALVALHFLRTRVGSWKLLAKTLGFEPYTLRNVRKGLKRVSINMAYSVARLAAVSFEDVVTGKYPVKGTCPHCGHVAKQLLPERSP